MSACDHHPWKLIAPWWRWPRQLAESGAQPRATRPVIQKYESSDPVSAFLKDPQQSLAFTTDDQVHTLVAVSPKLDASGKRRRFADQELRPNGVRKLFLTSHKRFYLVVCELHCDRPGLPAVDRDRVCEAGMVVRRHGIRYAPQFGAEAAALLSRSSALAAQIARIGRGERKRVLQKRHRVTPLGVVGALAGAAATEVKATLETGLDARVRERREALEAELAEVRRELLKWKAKSGAVEVTEGWIASGFENVGSWQPVEDEPEEVAEAVFPLYPLVSDPRDGRHDAAGRTLYYGLIPTGGREVDATGAGRFDDRTRYSVRCFVRRHACDCPKTGERNDCGGELVWSRATEEYRLASHFDPVGTAHQPVTIQLPNIPELAAMTDAKLPVRMEAPAGSSMKFSVPSDGSLPESGELGGIPQICFISIPLITIIATFVLNLFLPIVVLLFNLWFLLGLKFCIPPSISFAAGADLSLNADLNLALKAELDLAVEADLTAALGTSMNLGFSGTAGAAGSLGAGGTIAGNTLSLNAGTPGLKVTAGYSTKVDGVPQPQPGLSNDLLAGLSARVSGRITEEEAVAAVSPPGPVFEARVERTEVFA